MAEVTRFARDRRPARGWGALVIAGLLLASCTAHDPASAMSATGTATTAASTTTAFAATGTSAPTPSVPVADLAAIDSALDAINATAGGTVAAQRTVLQRLVVPSEADAQRDCPAAHNTLRLQAVPDDLRLSPDDSPAGVITTTMPTGSGAAGTSAATGGPGTTGARTTDYLLPVLITIFTGGRITGTDLTTLRLFVTNGTARIGHLCVS